VPSLGLEPAAAKQNQAESCCNNAPSPNLSTADDDLPLQDRCTAAMSHRSVCMNFFSKDQRASASRNEERTRNTTCLPEAHAHYIVAAPPTNNHESLTNLRSQNTHNTSTDYFMTT